MEKKFGHELKETISQYGGTPDKRSSVVAKAHQVWISVKDTLTGQGEAILAECICEEEPGLADYKKKLQQTSALPAVEHAEP